MMKEEKEIAMKEQEAKAREDEEKRAADEKRWRFSGTSESSAEGGGRNVDRMIVFFEHLAGSQAIERKVMTELHQQGMKSQQDILLALTADRREQNKRERRESIKRDERSTEEAKERLDRF